jgi:serine/threonine protein kinase
MRQYVQGRRTETGAQPRDLKTLLAGKATNPMAMDMLQKMLCFSPFQRWSADFLLDHPYLQDIRTGRHHTPATRQFRWRYDCITNLTEPALRKLFWQELLGWHPESRSIPAGVRPASPVAFDVKQTREKEDTKTKANSVKYSEMTV